MQAYNVVLALAAIVAAGLLAWRMRRGGVSSRYPIFFSYVVYALSGAVVGNGLYWLRPEVYPTFFWYYYLVDLLAEFGVIIEVSDQVFHLYPAVRRLGTLINACVCLTFTAAYIVPSVMRAHQSRTAILQLAEASAVTKAAMVIAILVAARACQLPLGRNISGIMLGLVFFFGINIVNFALDKNLHPAVYWAVFSVVGSSSYVLRLAIWAGALWRFEPVAAVRKEEVTRDVKPEALQFRLDRHDSALERLLRR